MQYCMTALADGLLSAQCRPCLREFPLMRAESDPPLLAGVSCRDRQERTGPIDGDQFSRVPRILAHRVPAPVVFTFPTLLSVLGETVEATNESLSMTVGFVE